MQLSAFQPECTTSTQPSGTFHSSSGVALLTSAGQARSSSFRLFVGRVE